MEGHNEQMNSKDSKANVAIKMEPPTKKALNPRVKMGKVETMETFDFPKGVKAEPVVKAEPFGLPKTEKSERFLKKEPLDSPKIEKKNQMTLPILNH